MLPPSKRALRPTASQPTTAEHYGQKHGIPDDIQAALQNVGRKGRMAVSQGRTLDRTQSFPVSSTSQNPFDSFNIPPLRGFMTSQETFQQAQQTVLAHGRSNELRPYSDTLDPDFTQPDPKSSPTKAPPTLSFNGEGMDEDMGAGSRRKARNRPFIPARKRKEDEGSDTETETGTDTDEHVQRDQGIHESAGGDTGDFPPVFTSPQITQPELFSAQKGGLPSRLVRGMPGRTLGKTVSAPVGGLGRWGGLSGSGGEGMDVDGEAKGEDGFDVSDWAASENF